MGLKEALITALVALGIAGIERFTAWLRAKSQSKVIEVIANGVEKIDDKTVKDAINKVAESKGVKDVLDKALGKIGYGPKGDGK